MIISHGRDLFGRTASYYSAGIIPPLAISISPAADDYLESHGFDAESCYEIVAALQDCSQQGCFIKRLSRRGMSSKEADYLFRLIQRG